MIHFKPSFLFLFLNSNYDKIHLREEVNLLKQEKHKIPQHLLFLFSAESYFYDNMEMVFFTSIGTIVGRISLDSDNHFSKIHNFSKEREKELLIEDVNLLPSDRDSFIVIEDAKIYPTPIINPKGTYELYPEIALFLNQIIGVSMIPKLS